MINCRSQLLITVSVILLCACGAGSDGDAVSVMPETPDAEVAGTDPVNAPTRVLTGRFIDVAVVQGLAFETETQQGFTGANGSFTYQGGEQITFSIGDVSLPSATAEQTMTTLDLFATQDVLQGNIVNLNRLFATLDEDGVLANGVQINEAAHQAAAGLVIDFSSPQFDSAVTNLVANAGAAQSRLVSVPEVVTAYVSALDAHDLWLSDCTANSSMVGRVAQFDTFFHEVSGTLTVLDDCTLEISNFNYDGGGPSVLFYAGVGRDYADGSQFALPFRLNGKVFDNSRLRLHLSDTQTLDTFDSLSVWCFDFRINFGDVFLGET